MSSKRAKLGFSRRQGPVNKRTLSDLPTSIVADERPRDSIAPPAMQTRLRRTQAEPPRQAEISARRGQGLGAQLNVALVCAREASLVTKGSSAPMSAVAGTAAAAWDSAPPRPTTVTNNAMSSVNSSSSSGGSDWEAEASTEQLSSYELKRLRNIQENLKFLADLKIRQAAESLRQVNKSPHSHPRPRVKVVQPPLPPRTPSRRLRRLDPLDVPLPEMEELSLPTQEAEYRAPLIPPGPLKMEATNLSADEQDMLLEVWRRSEMVETTAQEPGGTGWLRGLHQGSCRIAKVVKNQIRSVAVHPSVDHLLVAVGDISGNLGFWDLDAAPGEAGDGAVTQFRPHSGHLLCLRFSAAPHARLYSCGLDGSLRCADLHRGVFDEVYANESGLTDLSFQSEDGATLLVGRCDGGVSLVDCRSPRRKHGDSDGELHWTAHERRVHSVHVHPVHAHYFVTASTDHTVKIHDVRVGGSGWLHKVAAVAMLQKHRGVVNSAYFSPLTGNRLLTTSTDNSMHVYDTQALGSQITCSARVCHNNTTGRWVARMRGVWTPGGEDTWVCGSMERPRHLDVYSATGKKLLMLGRDEMSSICPVVGFHPARPVLAACSSSGRVHIFTP